LSGGSWFDQIGCPSGSGTARTVPVS